MSQVNECPFAKTKETPCVVRDGDSAVEKVGDMKFVCSGCSEYLHVVYSEVLSKSASTVRGRRSIVNVVHILQYGRPQCLFTDKLPKNWPDGHYWLTFEQALQDTSKITCANCRALITSKGAGA